MSIMSALHIKQELTITLKIKTEIFKIRFYFMIEIDLSNISDRHVVSAKLKIS